MDEQTLEDQPDAREEEARLKQIAEQQRLALETMVAKRIQDAIDARVQSGIEQIWLEDEDQYEGIDDVTPAQNLPPARAKSEKKEEASGDRRSRIFLNITAPKTDIAVSRVQELLVPHDDKPWEISATPVPEFDRAAAGMMPDAKVTLADGSQASAKDAAVALKAKADETAESAGNYVEDWFVEGGFYSELRDVIRDSGRAGTGVLKGPVPMTCRNRKWQVKDGVAILEAKDKIAPSSKRVDYWDCFPDPSCGENIHHGSFFVERDYLTARKLRELSQIPDYDKQALIDILKEGPRRRSRYDDRDTRENVGQVPTLQTETFEVFYYYGDIDPQTLIGGGFVVQGFNDAEDAEAQAQQVQDALQLLTVPVVCTVINERIVRVTLNPLETGEFPFDFFPWEPRKGQPWGKGVPRKMAVAQRGVNAAVRALAENAGMSKGPQVVIDRDRIEPANGVYEVTGGKLWYWKPGEEVKDVRFAFQSFLVESAQAQLQAIVDFFLAMADQLSNLPMLLQGIVGSQAPETLGGQALAVANATSPLRAIAKLFDDRLMVPHLKRYYDWLMQDPAIPASAKGDLQCRARGASVLIYRDVAAQMLPQLAPLVNDPKFGLSPEKWIAEVLRSGKVNPQSVSFTPAEREAIQEAQQNAQQPADPRIAAAQINAEAKAADREATVALKQAQLQIEREEAQADRDHDLLIKEMEREIQVLEFAGQKEISFEGVRAMLAAKSMDIRNKRELFAAEKQFAQTTGKGRGL